MSQPESKSGAAARRHAEIIERLRGAASYEFGNLNTDQRNLYYAAADAIEAAHALLHGAGVDHDALLVEREAFLALESAVRTTHGNPTRRPAALACPECAALIALDEVRRG